MQTMKFKFQRVFIIPACWYHSAMILLIPYVTSSRFVDEMIKPMAPKPTAPLPQPDNPEDMRHYSAALADYHAALKTSQAKVLEAWHKDIAHTSEYRIRYDGDGNYVIIVNITLSGSRKFIAPFKQQWPVSDVTLMN